MAESSKMDDPKEFDREKKQKEEKKEKKRPVGSRITKTHI